MSIGISVGLLALIKNFWPGVFMEFQKDYIYADGSFYVGYGDYDLAILSTGGNYTFGFKGFKISPFLGLSVGRFRIYNRSNYSAGINYGIRFRKSGFFIGFRGFYDRSGNPIWLDIGKKIF